MEFRDVVRRRRMVRAYTREPVDDAVVRRILDTARRGPSAGYAQGTEFVVVTDALLRSEVAAACGESDYRARGFAPWLSSAPVHVIPCVSEAAYRQRYAEADKGRSRGPDAWQVPYWWADGGAALMLLLLAAVDEGLAAGFLDIADPARLSALLGIPDGTDPLGLVTIGHAAPDRPSGSLRRGRRPLDDVVHWQHWGRKD